MQRIIFSMALGLVLVLAAMGIGLAQSKNQQTVALQAAASSTVTPQATVTTTVSTPEGLLALEQLPPYILLVAKRAAPDAKIAGFNWDLNDTGKPVYELVGIDKEQQIEISILLDGTIEKVVRNITMRDVPTEVVGLLDKYVPDAKIAAVNLAEGANSLKRYEFQGTLNGIDLAIEIAANANEIRITESKRQ